MRLLTVVAYGLSDGAIVRLAVGSVSVVMVIVILSVCSLVAMRRTMYQRRLALESPNKLGTMREARWPIDYGHYGDRDSMGDHRPDMEMGSAHRPGYDEGPYYSRVSIVSIHAGKSMLSQQSSHLLLTKIKIQN